MMTKKMAQEAKVLLDTFDPQDAINFVLAYSTFMALGTLDLKDNWLAIPSLSIFQLVRKPDSLKRILRPIRVGMAPVSVILTWNASYHQILTTGVLSRV